MIDLADAHYPVDISKAKRLLGWQPRHSLRETLPEMLRRLKQDPAGWYAVNNLELPERQLR
jgi:nucleoside-diphosphate-sugar epimerase